MRGRFDPALGTSEQWCARHLLARIHSYTQNRLRREIEPVSSQDFMRFLLRWQHVAPGTRRQGRAGLLVGGRAVAGVRAGRRRLGGSRPAGSGGGLPAAVAGGPLPVGRGRAGAGCRCARPKRTASPGEVPRPRRGPPPSPSRSGLTCLGSRWRPGASASPEEPAHGPGRDVLDASAGIRGHVLLGPARRHAAASRSRCRRAYGTWSLVGIVTADGFGAVRSLFSRRETGRAGTSRAPAPRAAAQPGHPASHAPAGRGPLGAPGYRRSHPGALPLATDELAEHVAGQLLARWGVVFWDLAATRTWPCRGGRSSGRCGASRPGAWSAAGGS